MLILTLNAIVDLIWLFYYLLVLRIKWDYDFLKFLQRFYIHREKTVQTVHDQAKFNGRT